MAALVSTTANATVDYCVAVNKTPDGFLAVREGPDASSKMIAKVHSGDKLNADADDGKWTRVVSITGEFTTGWVATRYIKFDKACTDRMYRD
jgi:hypothetical protein